MEDMEKAEVQQGVRARSAAEFSHKQGKPGPAALAESTEAWLAVPGDQGLRKGSSEQSRGRRMSEKRWDSPLLRKSLSRKGPEKAGWTQEGPRWVRLPQGGTHHWVAGLKHLTEQNTTLLPGKWFSERIQDTGVPGIRGIWALKEKGRDVPMALSTKDLPIPQVSVPGHREALKLPT